MPIPKLEKYFNTIKNENNYFKKIIIRAKKNGCTLFYIEYSHYLSKS